MCNKVRNLANRNGATGEVAAAAAAGGNRETKIEMERLKGSECEREMQWNYHILVKSQSQFCPPDSLQSKSVNLNERIFY